MFRAFVLFDTLEHQMALIFAIVRIIVYTRLIGLIKFPIRLRSSKKQPTDSESLHSFGKLFHHSKEEYFFQVITTEILVNCARQRIL